MISIRVVSLWPLEINPYPSDQTVIVSGRQTTENTKEFCVSRVGLPSKH